jgi:CBS domain-containing protein
LTCISAQVNGGFMMMAVARNAGRQGKAMRARSVAAMNLATAGVVTTAPETSLADCARLMRAEHVGSVIVVEQDSDGRRPLGIVTDRDIVIEAVAVGLDVGTITAGDVMARPLAIIHEDDDVLTALARMREHGVRRLPVVDREGRLAGILTIDNLLEAFSEQLEAAVGVVKAEQTRETTLRR